MTVVLRLAWHECGTLGTQPRRADLLLTIWRHEGRCRSVTQVRGSYGIVRELVSAGAVAALGAAPIFGAFERETLAYNERAVCPSLTSRSDDPRVGPNSYRWHVVVVVRFRGQIRTVLV
jgi:hypothetical protein